VPSGLSGDYSNGDDDGNNGNDNDNDERTHV
jgi:hypothetical protein